MRWLGLPVVAACTTFEDPTLVIDLRIIAMTATPPEQVIDLDPTSPSPAGDLMAQLQPTIICTTVADPGRGSNLHWSMRACLIDNGRCDPEHPTLDLGFGEALDPELATAPFCAPVVPSLSLIALLVEAVEEDSLRGAGGVSYSIELQVGPSEASRDDDVFATKELHLFARFPEDRVANHNPTLDSIQLQSPELDIPPVASCAAELPRPTFRPGTRVAIVPVEGPDTRENYPVLAIDGSFERFDETLRYQFLTTSGSLRDEFTGGPRDLFGNPPVLSTDWTAPATDHAFDVQLWMIQRDERGGATVYPMCFHVEP